jgi:hypothetical protein
MLTVFTLTDMFGTSKTGFNEFMLTVFTLTDMPETRDSKTGFGQVSLSFGVLMPLSAVFQLYHGNQF